MAFLQGPATPAYPVFEDDKIPAAVYRERRQRVKAQLGPDEVAVLFTNPDRNRTNDTDYRFRADSNFSYLTGFEESDAALILAPGGITVDGKKVTEVLFVNTSNAMSETWLGYRMGPVNAVKLLGVEAALPNNAFAATLGQLKPTSWFTTGPPDPSGTVQRMTSEFTTWRTAGPARAKRSLNGMLAIMRVKKDADEIRLLKKAAEASVLAHLEAMRSVEAGMREYHLQAVVEYIFARNGCEFPAYGSIVGSGPNGCILHYETNRRKMNAGDMIVMDVAGEYHGYAADVTRSFPVGGKFSDEQRAIYNIVLEAQEAGIAQCRAGKPFGAPHEAAARIVANGLIRLGIVKSEAEVDRYFMHGTSHYIGLDVHDSEGASVLQDGATLTVEPGIYIKAGSPCDKKWWNIGVRIEDDILVTSGAPVNMSGALPRKIADIEALMREKGIGNVGVKPAG